MKDITFEEFLNMKNSILVDVRTPSEFVLENIPHSVNIPILLDDERREVGTAYVQKSKEIAKRLGVEFISNRLPEIFNEIQKLSKQYNNIIFMCARGGMRSGTITALMESLGYRVGRLAGGYKAYRKYVQNAIPELNKNFKYIVVHGKTGVGKTKILNKMKDLGISFMDLEGFAAHKGSFFGALGETIPQSQKRMDGYVFDYLYNCKSKYIVVESESKRIGNVYVPESVYNAMTDGVHMFIHANIENRVKILMEDYSQVPITEIKECIDRIARYTSSDKIKKYHDLADNGDLETLTKFLIVEYYDPLYLVSIAKHDFVLEYEYNDMDECAKRLTNYINENYKEEYDDSSIFWYRWYTL